MLVSSYFAGIVPVTLVNSRSDIPTRSLVSKQANHAEYSGEVLFRNTFEGELPAVEYPKINVSWTKGETSVKLMLIQFYMVMSLVYFVLGCGWAYLCVRHRDELL